MKINRFLPYLLFITAYGLLCLYMLVTTFNFLYPMLVFNTVLATLPLVFISLSHDFRKEGKRVWSWVFLVFWLLFFPNALYMITDFIHITGNKLIQYEESLRYEITRGVVYSTELMAWLKLLVIGIGCMYATLVGLLSLDLFLLGLEKKGKIFQGISLLLVAGLTGVGIYIGRFLRFNSWDILDPLGLAKNLIGVVDKFSLGFAFIFSLYTLAIYGIYHLFKNNHK